MDPDWDRRDRLTLRPLSGWSDAQTSEDLRFDRQFDNPITG